MTGLKWFINEHYLKLLSNFIYFWRVLFQSAWYNNGDTGKNYLNYCHWNLQNISEWFLVPFIDEINLSIYIKIKDFKICLHDDPNEELVNGCYRDRTRKLIPNYKRWLIVPCQFSSSSNKSFGKHAHETKINWSITIIWKNIDQFLELWPSHNAHHHFMTLTIGVCILSRKDDRRHSA